MTIESPAAMKDPRSCPKKDYVHMVLGCQDKWLIKSGTKITSNLVQNATVELKILFLPCIGKANPFSMPFILELI